jgi:Family of unknown function (DUF6098)
MAPLSQQTSTVRTLAELADLVRRWEDGRDGRSELYVRWTRDVERDLRTGVSRDELTGIELPGLSANSLKVESWWNDRPLPAWLARRLYDYRDLSEKRGPNTCPWVIAGRETGRGPDNEPLVTDAQVVARISMDVLDEVQEEVHRLGDDWGTLVRR